MVKRIITFLFLASLLVGVLPAAAQSADPLVNVGSPPTPFSQNKQNEPWIAVDASNPSVLAAGSNDEIDMEACAAGDPTTCPFTPGVGVSGIYFSFDGGATWTQPTYTGWTARNCLGPDPCQPEVGPIGTLPWYYENGLVADGDPALAFGPQPDENGNFSWANGSRLYYANLTSNFSAERRLESFRGFEAVAVSRTDDVATAAAGGEAGKSAWMQPVVVTRQNEALFSDKEGIWADNAESSPYFGNVYVCNVGFRGAAGSEPVMVAFSTDGGGTWRQRQISNAANTNQGQGRAGGRQGCSVRTDSQGVVYVFWEGSFKNEEVQWLARSFNGGQKFERPQVVATVVPVGAYDPVQRRYTFDGVAGARTDSFPIVDIANGAPTGAGATDAIVMAWSDGRNGLNNEMALVQVSTNQGKSWSGPYDATDNGDRPDFSAVTISPDGQDVYLVYDAFLDPWREDLSGSRNFEGVIRHAEFSDLNTWQTLLRGEPGDARASSANSLAFGFLGDYNYIISTNDYASAVWNDARNAAVCDAIDAYRQSLVDGSPIDRPAPGSDCPATFGNTDIYGASVADPTP